MGGQFQKYKKLPPEISPVDYIQLMGIKISAESEIIS